jgi:hypothetical protein
VPLVVHCVVRGQAELRAHCT